MGCASHYYALNEKQDFFTKAFSESIKVKKQSKIQGDISKREYLTQAQKEEAERLRLEQEENQRMIDEIQNRTGPVGYFDSLEQEIPKMEFGLEAPEDEVMKELGMKDDENEKKSKNENEDDKDKDKDKEKDKDDENKEQDTKSKKSNESVKEEIKQRTKLKGKTYNAGWSSTDLIKDQENDENKQDNQEGEDKEADNNNNNNTSKNINTRTNDKKETTRSDIADTDHNNKKPENENNPQQTNPRKDGDESESEWEIPKTPEPFPSKPEEWIITVIGDENAGKTSLIKKYVKGIFTSVYTKTKEIIENKEKVFKQDDIEIPLNIVDTLPIPRYGTCEAVQEQILKSHIIIYIFDLSQEDAIFKIKLTFTNFDFDKRSIISLIGNKTDRWTKFAKENMKQVMFYCKKNMYWCDFISCDKTSKVDIGRIFEEKIIAYYWDKYSG